MTRDVHHEVVKALDLAFIHAALFSFEDHVLVRLGRSMRPVNAIRSIVATAPFPVVRAAYVHALSQSRAYSIERRTVNALAAYQTRGQWFLFGLDQGEIFANTIRSVYADVVGDALRWHSVKLREIDPR